jgi:hypothetical protein
MYCSRCNQSFSLKSNRGTIEEFERQRAPFMVDAAPACRNSDCVNYEAVGPERYQSFGTSRGGSARYRCKACRRTFTVSNRSTLRQRHPEINELVLNLLINKMPMRRICEVASIEPAVLYARIHFFHRQALRFVVDHESALRDKLNFAKLRIAVDRQDHVFNWASSADRRNTKLSASGSADCESGYVFGIELDVDPAMNPYEVDLHAREIGDYQLSGPFRRYARFFLPGDEETGTAPPAGVELAEAGTKLPAAGLRIHPEYVLMGHFQFLRWLLPNVEAFEFYLDQEPSIRGAFLAACLDLVAQRRADAYFVRIGKTLTIDERKLAVARSETYLDRLQKQHPTLTRRQIARDVMKQRYLQVRKAEPNAANRCENHITERFGMYMPKVSLSKARLLGWWSYEEPSGESVIIDEELRPRGRIRKDLVYKSNKDAVRVELIFEFKKLEATPGSFKIYRGKEGMRRFVDGEYAKGLPLALMVGMLIGDQSACVQGLRRSLLSVAAKSDLRMVGDASGALLRDPSTMFPAVALFDTEHNRPAASAPSHGTMLLAHMFVRLPAPPEAK